MDIAKRQKIHKAICKVINYTTKGFLAFMAVVFALAFLVSLMQIFKSPAVSLIGCFGFGGGAWTLWETSKSF